VTDSSATEKNALKYGILARRKSLDRFHHRSAGASWWQVHSAPLRRLQPTKGSIRIRLGKSDNPHMSDFPPEDRPRPESLTDLFTSFTLLALQGFGGVLAVVQRELVENKRWMTRDEFIEDWSVAQIMPGPNVVNLALIIGGRYFGLKGALVGLAGMLLVPLMLVMALAMVYSKFADHPGVAGALRGMGAVAAGLILATGLKLISALTTNIMGWRWCAALGLACLVGIVVLRLPLAYVLFGLGSVACTLAYQRLKP
jgi:chromate transporter